MKQVNSFVEMCVKKDYISQEKAAWLQYALEKRIVTAMGFIPLLFLGLTIAPPATVVGFLATFCLLRSRTNGYHANSIGRCLVYSMGGELIFLKVLPAILDDVIYTTILIVASFLIWSMAPYNHPNMDLSQEEIAACSKSAKCRLVVCFLALSISYGWGGYHLAQGILLGIVMTAATLIMAYCIK